MGYVRRRERLIGDPAIDLAGSVCADIAEMVDALVEECGKEKMEFVPPSRDESLDKAIAKKWGDDTPRVQLKKDDWVWLVRNMWLFAQRQMGAE